MMHLNSETAARAELEEAASSLLVSLSLLIVTSCPREMEDGPEGGTCCVVSTQRVCVV